MRRRERGKRGGGRLIHARRLRRHSGVRGARAGGDRPRRIHDTAGAHAARSAKRPRPEARAIAGQGACSLARYPGAAAGHAQVRGRARGSAGDSARRAGGRRVRTDPPRGGPRLAASRVPQHPRLETAALAGCRPDRARDRGGRRDDRHHDHADGRRTRHRADDRGRGRPDRCAGDGRNAARPAGPGWRAGDRHGPAAPRARRRAGGDAAAGRGRDLRAQGRQGRRRDRLGTPRRRARRVDPRLRSRRPARTRPARARR